MTIALIVLAVVVVALVGLAIVGFNKLRTADIAAQEALGGIDVQLTRRADLIPNLVETVKGYAAHEKGVFEQVTAARARVSEAARGKDVGEKAAADAQMEQALVRVNAVAEAYPDLKASANFQDLQKQLADTENQISFARQYYNDAVAQLNTALRTIPWMLFSGMAGVSTREFYEAPAGSDTPPQVDFGQGAAAVPPAAPPPVVAPGPENPAVPPAAGEPQGLEPPPQQKPPA